MTKVVVVGCGGSGKSVLACRMGDQSNLPVIHLDGVYYDENWKPLDKDTFSARQRQLVDKPAWVIDGNYASTLPIRLTAADVIIMLDLPASSCLWGVFKRRLRYRGGQHHNQGVYDRINVGFIRYIIGYRKSMAPRVRSLVNQHAPDAIFHAPRSRRQANQVVDELVAQLSPVPT